MNNNYDAIIIGSGIGGLTCGNLLAKHGMKVLILEQHFKPGGICTSYTRNNYVFNFPTVTTNLRKGDHVERLFSYIGVNKYLEFYELDKLSKVIYPDFEIDWYSDIYRLEYEFISKFPEDTKSIQKFFKELRDIYYEVQESHYNPNFLQKLAYPFKFQKLVKYNNYTFKQFTDKFFKNHKLKDALGIHSVSLGLDTISVSGLYYIIMIMSYAQGGIWYPKGGFQCMSDAFVNCFKESNGEIRLKRKVKKIIIKNKKAVGVQLENGENIYGKYIISNADTKKTFLELLDPIDLKKKFLKKVERLEQSYSAFVVNLVVNMDLSKFDNYAWINIPDGYESLTRMLSLAEKNEVDLDKSSFIIMLTSLIDKYPDGYSVISMGVNPIPYDYSQKWFANDKEKREELKEKLADKLIKRAETVIPGLSKNIILKDISTPLAFERYVSSYKGSLFDTALIPSQSITNKPGHKTNIKGLYLTGAKSMPGPGITAAILSGLYTADTIIGGKLTNGKTYLREDLS